MERPTTIVLRIGAWRVDPGSGQVSRDGESTRLELRTMRLLLCLAEHAGAVVSIDHLLNHVWNGVTVTADSVYQAVTSLRRILGDDPKHPTYIATVPRFGYRMVALVSPWEDATTVMPVLAGKPGAHFNAQRRTGLLLAAFTILCLGLGGGAWQLIQGKAGNQQTGSAVVPPSQRSVAVLPFLDLTEGMKQGEFTDGMTEELIDQLSQVPGLRVPSPTSSFYFKDKEAPVSTVANELRVAYVLDGSVRKSGARLRVAARSVRADTGYVVWSRTYDRPWRYTLMLQNDIAGELTEAVQASLD